MKKVLSFLVAFALILGCCAGCGDTAASSAADSVPSVAEPTASPTPNASLTSDFNLAFVTDYNDISDQSTNQAIYEACQKYCDKFRYSFNYYKPINDTDECRMEMVDAAVSEGYQTVLMDGITCAAVLNEAAAKYPDVRFIAMDICAEELNESGQIPGNVYCVVFRGELCGYMAGYAAVKFGYKQFGFLGATDCDASKRYGAGFIQGVNQAAKELGETEVTVRYCYTQNTYGDDNITEAMNTWCAENKSTILFAAGGSVYTSAGSAARSNRGGIIGSELDQATYIKADYGKGLTVTSAVKNFYAAVAYVADRITGNTYPGGTQDLYGLISDTPENNYVALADSTSFNGKFSEDDYTQLVSFIRSGAFPVSYDPAKSPSSYASYITVQDQGTIS